MGLCESRIAMASIAISLTIILIAGVSFAQNPEEDTSGFSGRIQAGGLFLQTDSQLSTDGSSRRVDDLDRPADTHKAVIALASVYLRYQFENGTALYAGNPLEVGEGLSLAAGVTQPTGAGTLDVAVTWLPIEEVWKDPYQTSGARDQTDVDVYGLKIEWQRIGGSPWELNYRIDRVDVDNDVIGDIESDLERDGWIHQVGLKYNLDLQPGTSLKPGMAVSVADMDGASNRYHGVQVETLLQRARPPWILIGVLQGALHRYQETHPLFDKTRRDTQVTTFAQIMRLGLFGYPRLFATVAGGYVWSQSNIDFFDSRTLLGLASVGINF